MENEEKKEELVLIENSCKNDSKCDLTITKNLLLPEVNNSKSRLETEKSCTYCCKDKNNYIFGIDKIINKVEKTSEQNSESKIITFLDTGQVASRFINDELQLSTKINRDNKCSQQFAAMLEARLEETKIENISLGLKPLDSPKVKHENISDTTYTTSNEPFTKTTKFESNCVFGHSTKEEGDMSGKYKTYGREVMDQSICHKFEDLITPKINGSMNENVIYGSVLYNSSKTKWSEENDEFEKRLPLKKRKSSISTVKISNSGFELDDIISYPATPMLSIADITRPFKTPAEKKELSGFTQDFTNTMPIYYDVPLSLPTNSQNSSSFTSTCYHIN